MTSPYNIASTLPPSDPSRIYSIIFPIMLSSRSCGGDRREISRVTINKLRYYSSRPFRIPRRFTNSAAVRTCEWLRGFCVCYATDNVYVRNYIFTRLCSRASRYTVGVVFNASYFPARRLFNEITVRLRPRPSAAHTRVTTCPPKRSNTFIFVANPCVVARSLSQCTPNTNGPLEENKSLINVVIDRHYPPSKT